MEQIHVEKEKLLKILEKNLKLHQELYKETMIGFKKK